MSNLTKMKQSVTIRFVCNPTLRYSKTGKTVEWNQKYETINPNYLIDLDNKYIINLPFSFKTNKHNNLIVSIMVQGGTQETSWNIYFDLLPKSFQSISREIVNKTGIALTPNTVQIEKQCVSISSCKIHSEMHYFIYSYLSDSFVFFQQDERTGEIYYVNKCEVPIW